MSTENERVIETSWETGRLYIHLNPSQRKIYDGYKLSYVRVPKFVVNCSRKLGKSVLGLFIATEKCIQKKEALVAFVAPTVDHVQKYMKQLYQVVFSSCPEHLKPKLLAKEIVFANGSRIMFCGVGKGVGDSYNNLRSFAFDLVILDEAGFSANLDEIVDGALVSTLLPRNGNMLLLSTPPVTPDHAFKQYCDEAVIDQAYIMLTIRDSHYSLEQQDKFIKALGGLNSHKVRREYFCEFVIDKDFQIIPEWDDKFVLKSNLDEIRKDPNWKFWHKYESLDPGWSDFSVCLFGYRNSQTRQVIVLGEIMMKSPEQTIDNLAAAILSKEKEIFGELPVFKRIADNNKPDLLREFNLRHKLYFYPVESKGRLDEMVSDVREVVKGELLYVSPSCIQLLGCLRNGVYTKTKAGNRGKEFARSKVFGHYDAMAALIYWIREMDTTHDPVPPLAQKNMEDTFAGKKVLAEQNNVATAEIIAAGLDSAMQQEFNLKDHDESYD